MNELNLDRPFNVVMANWALFSAFLRENQTEDEPQAWCNNNLIDLLPCVDAQVTDAVNSRYLRTTESWMK
jgi:hypothetical protein